MTQLTEGLCAALPHFASLFRQNDRKKGVTWRIIQWENITPDKVRPEQVRFVDELDTKYTNQTKALISSRLLATQAAPPHSGRSEKNHPGVWKWTIGDTVHYQSVMPEVSAAKQSTNGHHITEPEKIGPATTMVRVGEEAHRMLREYAAEDGKTLQAVLEDAVREYDRQRYFAKADAAYQALRSNAQAWNEEIEERKAWDATLLDNQETDEVWHEDGTVTVHAVRERQNA